MARFSNEKPGACGTEKLSHDAAERMRSVVALAAQCLGSPAAIRDFLTRDHFLLGRRPIDVVLDSMAGRDCVLKLLSEVHAPHLPITKRES